MTDGQSIPLNVPLFENVRQDWSPDCCLMMSLNNGYNKIGNQKVCIQYTYQYILNDHIIVHIEKR